MIGSYPIQDITPGAPYFPSNTVPSEYSSAPPFPDQNNHSNMPTAPLLYTHEGESYLNVHLLDIW